MEFRLRNGEIVTISEELTKKALQYSPTNGLPELVDWIRTLQIEEHGPPNEDFEICLGNGSQDVITRALEMLVDPSDTLLIESPAYVGILAFLRPLGCKLVEILTDADGLIPEILEDVMSRWKDFETRPRVLYTVPTGGNPTGTSTTLERKEKIYELAQKYNLIILEDDPYYYLQFGEDRLPSYLSMDVDQRVLRFDSFSKILSAGIRIGWVSGPKGLVDRIVLHGQATSLHPSGISQAMIFGLLIKWGHAGFLEHCDDVATFYQEKRDSFLKAADEHLKGVAEWAVPAAGMFVWLKLIGIEDSTALINQRAVAKRVLFVPGYEFMPNLRPTPYVRASYSTATVAEIDEALKRLAELVNESKAENGRIHY